MEKCSGHRTKPTGPVERIDALLNQLPSFRRRHPDQWPDLCRDLSALVEEIRRSRTDEQWQKVERQLAALCKRYRITLQTGQRPPEASGTEPTRDPWSTPSSQQKLRIVTITEAIDRVVRASAGPPQRQATPPIYTWPEVRIPQEAVAGTVFPIKVTARTSPSEASSKMLGLQRRRAGPVDLEVELVLPADDALVATTATTAVLRVSDDHDSAPLVFEVRAVKTGLHQVKVVLRRDQIEQLVINSQITVMEAELAPAKPAAPAVLGGAVETAVAKAGPRSYLKLSFDHCTTSHTHGERYLRVTLSGTDDLLQVPYEGITALHEDAPQFLTQLGVHARNLSTTSGSQSDRLCLEDLGSEIARGLLPEPILEVLADTSFRPGTPLHIESENAWAPWEMVWLGSGFLGEHFAVTRYLRRGTLRHTLTGGRAVLVTSGHGDLRVDQERQILRQISGGHPDELLELLQVQRLLKADKPVGFLHFACHGETETDDPVGGRLKLGHDDLREINVQPLASARPHGPLVNALVMLNACQAGIPGINLSGHGGWAKRFLDAGAAVFIAPSWSVRDTVAGTFAESFYQRLQAGDTVGEAARQARSNAKTEGAPDHLAYALYAAPDVCLR